MRLAIVKALLISGACIITSAGAIAANTAAASAQSVPQRMQAPVELADTMERLRRFVVDHHTLITHRRLSPLAAKALVAKVLDISASLATIAKSSGSAVVSAWAEDVRESAASMDRGPASPEMLQGLMRLVGILDAYPREFEHANWKKLQELR